MITIIEKLEVEPHGSRDLDKEVFKALSKYTVDDFGWLIVDNVRVSHIQFQGIGWTTSIDAIKREFPYLCVFASDIGADGMAMVKLVADTSTSPVIEHTGIAMTMELAWIIAAIKARAQVIET